MAIRGRIQNGVVVFDADATVPEGTEVDVVVRAAPETDNEAVLDAERQRELQIMDRIAALPIEGMTDPFTGADHDKALYGSYTARANSSSTTWALRRRLHWTHTSSNSVSSWHCDSKPGHA